MRFLFLQFNRLEKESHSFQNYGVMYGSVPDFLFQGSLYFLLFSGLSHHFCQCILECRLFLFILQCVYAVNHPCIPSSYPCSISLPYAFYPAISQLLSLAVSSHSDWLCCPCFSVFLLIWPLIYQTSGWQYTVVSALEKSLDK